MPDKNPDAGPHEPAPDYLLRHTAPPGLKRWVRTALVLAVAIAAIGIGWRLWKSHNTAQWTDDQAVPTVQIIKLSSAKNGGVLILPGDVEAFTNASIYAQVSGYLQSWTADIGARVKAGDYCALLAYLQMNEKHASILQQIRRTLRDSKKVATCLGFGPRFLHSTGQAYKGGPNSGVFLQITADDAKDVPIPEQKYTFGIVKAAQARGDFEVLAQRSRRALRVHITGSVESGLQKLYEAVQQALK